MLHSSPLGPSLSTFSTPSMIFSRRRASSAAGIETRMRIRARWIASVELVWRSLIHSDTFIGTESAKEEEYSRKLPYLTLSALVRANAKASFIHSLFDDADGVCRLCCWINTFLCDKGSNFTTKGSEIVFSLLLANLKIAFVKNLNDKA